MEEKKKKEQPKQDNKKDDSIENRITGKDDKYHRTIRDKVFGKFKLLNSANAWWIDDGKVERIIKAFKIDANVTEACYYAGITPDQYYYFVRLHKKDDQDFSIIKEVCGNYLGLKAKQHFAHNVEHNIDEAALKYLKMKRKDEGYTERTETTGANGKDLYENVTQEIVELTKKIKEATTTKKETNATKSKDQDNKPKKEPK